MISRRARIGIEDLRVPCLSFVTWSNCVLFAHGSKSLCQVESSRSEENTESVQLRMYLLRVDAREEDLELRSAQGSDAAWSSSSKKRVCSLAIVRQDFQNVRQTARPSKPRHSNTATFDQFALLRTDCHHVGSSDGSVLRQEEDRYCRCDLQGTGNMPPSATKR
jgi:hypothetical protein